MAGLIYDQVDKYLVKLHDPKDWILAGRVGD
jgi:hypothetical protein